jgi:hypothetical protein
MSDPRDAKRIHQMQERLDEVEEEIEDAQREADEVVPKPPAESFAQPGTIGTDAAEGPARHPTQRHR